jgi:hypothetical protein
MSGPSNFSSGTGDLQHVLSLNPKQHHCRLAFPQPLEAQAMTLKKAQRWSQRVTESSNALDLDKGVFTRANPRSIARSLKRSADRSKRRKTDPFRSAMSMLNFYMNRAGKKLSQNQRAHLQAAKNELRTLYRKPRRSGN